MKRCAVFVLALMSIGLAASNARAAFDVGTPAQLQYKALDGSSVNVESMKGKVVVISFWASWSEPSMREIPHLVGLNRAYKDQGMQLVGVTLDRDSDLPKLQKTIKDKDMQWPQWYDPEKTKDALSQWCDTGVPFVVIVNRDGKIMWKGHSKDLDAPFLKVWNNTPDVAAKPAETPDKTADAKTPEKTAEVVADKAADKAALAAGKSQIDITCDQVEAAIKQKNFDTAFTTLAKISADARNDKGALGTRIKTLGQQLNEYGLSKVIPEADQLVEREQFVKAVKKYQAVLMVMRDTEAFKKAREKLAELLSNPAARESAREWIRTQKPELLAADNGPPVADPVPAPNAVPAPNIAANRGANPAPVPDAGGLLPVPDAKEVQARTILATAEKYASSNNIPAAIRYYQRVVQLCPGTESAKTAQAALDKLAPAAPK